MRRAKDTEALSEMNSKAKNRAVAPAKVLITGVSGLIGSATYLHMAKQTEKYEVYGLDRSRKRSARTPSDRQLNIPSRRFFRCNIAKMGSVQRAVEGMDIVVHLAADPDGSSWDSVLHNNLIGAYNVFEASRQAKVRRIVYASSVRISEGHRHQEPYRSVAEGDSGSIPTNFVPLPTEVPPEPRSIYACGKVWVESLAMTYARTHGISCVALRIGWVTADDQADKSAAGATVWCSQRDAVQMIERCIDAPADLQFDILYCVSENTRRWVDIERARQAVGYVPQDSAGDSD